MEKKPETIDDVENSLEHLSFAPGEDVFLNQYAHFGECVDLFEELSDGGERNEMIEKLSKDL